MLNIQPDCQHMKANCLHVWNVVFFVFFLTRLVFEIFYFFFWHLAIDLQDFPIQLLLGRFDHRSAYTRMMEATFGTISGCAPQPWKLKRCYPLVLLTCCLHSAWSWVRVDVKLFWAALGAILVNRICVVLTSADNLIHRELVLLNSLRFTAALFWTQPEKLKKSCSFVFLALEQGWKLDSLRLLGRIALCSAGGWVRAIRYCTAISLKMNAGGWLGTVRGFAALNNTGRLVRGERANQGCPDQRCRGSIWGDLAPCSFEQRWEMNLMRLKNWIWGHAGQLGAAFGANRRCATTWPLKTRPFERCYAFVLPKSLLKNSQHWLSRDSKLFQAVLGCGVGTIRSRQICSHWMVQNA